MWFNKYFIFPIDQECLPIQFNQVKTLFKFTYVIACGFYRKLTCISIYISPFKSTTNNSLWRNSFIRSKIKTAKANAFFIIIPQKVIIQLPTLDYNLFPSANPLDLKSQYNLLFLAYLAFLLDFLL